MTGIAALAAAAAATQKIQGNVQTTTNTTPMSGFRVVTPTIVTPQGVKFTPVTPQGVKVTPVTRQIGMFIEYIMIS